MGTRVPSASQAEVLRIVAAGRFYPDFVHEDDGWYARWRAIGTVSAKVNDWVDEFVRTASVTRLSEDAEDQRHETLHDAWLMALRSVTGRVAWDEAECVAFAAELRDWNGGACADEAARRALVFAFAGGADGRFTLACAAPSGARAYRALGQATMVFPPLKGMRRQADGRLAVSLERAEAEGFVRGGAGELVAAGYRVEGVADLHVPVCAEAEVDEAAAAPAKTPLAARLVIRVAGEKVSADEIRFLLDQGSSLVFFRNRWIEVDRALLREALRALERRGGHRLTRQQALAFALGIGACGRLDVAEVRAHGWLRGLVNELRGEERFAVPSVPASFAGVLRGYQLRGFAWLKFLTDHGFGALLADDMGLGKTVETIAWICSEAERLKAAGGRAAVLVVVPLTLLANWRHELARFAPELGVYVHHGDHRHLASGFRRAAEVAEVTLTSYALIVREHREFAEVNWTGLVLDEAQAVKNIDTYASAAVRALAVPRRIALTGTPVENSVMDLWALEEFLNPGFLPDRQAFAERFVRSIARDEHSGAVARLRRALEPFVLRRLKSDGVVAGELGPKHEIKEYCALTPGERRDYEAALEAYRAGERRAGDVFALITRLKLVCDGQENETAAGSKFERLAELLAEIFANGESALVFTQYAKVGERLTHALQKRFGRDFPFLHGGLGASAREARIAAFNRATEPTAFVLSLRAGGFGLNLTKATHVIHFDRWWNPAVENQATDRAHRIGQSGTVFVHLLITAGTLEDRVDELMTRKARVAGLLIESGERFLMQMARDEFERLVALGA